jgi:hypothetical protein
MKKRVAVMATLFETEMLFVRLGGANVFGLEALGALHDIEGHGLAFLKATEAVGLDGREMNENVLTVGAAEKAESLGVIEPLNCTLFHLKLVPLR